MAGTRTFTFESQKVPWGDLQLVIISHFASVYGDVPYSEPASIISMTPLKQQLPEKATILKISNISIKISDFDNIIDLILYFATGGDSATMIEAKIYLDSTLKFWGTIDPQSVTRDELKKTSSFTIRSILAGLLDYDPDDDLLPTLTMYSAAPDTHFQLKEAIENILNFISIPAASIHYDVQMQFRNDYGIPYTYDHIQIKSDDFFGSSKVNDFSNCLDLLAYFAFAMATVIILDGDQIYFKDFQSYAAATLSNVMKKQHDFHSKNAIDGLKMRSPSDFSIIADVLKGDYDHGKNIADYEIYYLIDKDTSNSANLREDDTNSYKINDVIYGGTADDIKNRLADLYWDYYSPQDKEMIIGADSQNAVLDLITEGTESYRIYQAQLDFVRGLGSYKMRKVA